MRRALFLLLVTACSHGYRDPEDSAALRRDIDARNVASRVRIALGEDAQTAPYSAITVACEKGVVTLEGRVERESVRRRAEEVATNCAGFERVVNRIRVRSASDPR